MPHYYTHPLQNCIIFDKKNKHQMLMYNWEYCVISQHIIEVIYTRLLIHQKSNVKGI